MYSGGRELASCLGSTSPTCICVDTLNGGCLLCTLAGLLVDFISRPTYGTRSRRNVSHTERSAGRPSVAASSCLPPASVFDMSDTKSR